MARKVKCIDTGEYSTSDIAYKADNGKYYSSEDAYLQWDLNIRYRKKCIDLMYIVFEYDTQMKLPTYYYKKLREWEWYGYDVIYDTIKDLHNQFDYAKKNKTFNQEVAKMMYYCAIIENHLTDVYKKKQRNIFLSKKKDNIIIDFPVEDFGENTHRKKSGKDALSLLGDI